MRGALGDADPLAATDDAVRTFHPDEIIIATHPDAEANWLEHGLVVQASAGSTCRSPTSRSTATTTRPTWSREEPVDPARPGA